MALVGTGAAHQHGVALGGNEPTAREVAHECLVERRTIEFKILDILGERQFGRTDLVFDRSFLLLRNLSLQQVTDNAWWFMAPLDAGCHYLVIAGVPIHIQHLALVINWAMEAVCFDRCHQEKGLEACA